MRHRRYAAVAQQLRHGAVAEEPGPSANSIAPSPTSVPRSPSDERGRDARRTGADGHVIGLHDLVRKGLQPQPPAGGATASVRNVGGSCRTKCLCVGNERLPAWGDAVASSGDAETPRRTLAYPYTPPLKPCRTLHPYPSPRNGVREPSTKVAQSKPPIPTFAAAAAPSSEKLASIMQSPIGMASDRSTPRSSHNSTSTVPPSSWIM